MDTNDRTDNGSPLYQEEDVSASHLAGELLMHCEALKALNWEPATNEKEIAWHRKGAQEALSALSAHFLI